MIVLGIDPGLASTGIAVLVGKGSRLTADLLTTVKTKPATPHAERLLALYRGVSDVLEAYAIEAASVESWFVHPVSRSAMGMAEARGALLTAVAAGGVAVTEYTPNAIKQAVSGSGRADKAQVRAMVTRLTGANPTSDHEADALAAAICHLGAQPFAAAVGRAK